MIRYDLPAGEYHADPARSKSYLWKLYTGTPAHAEYGETESTAAMDLGTAVHLVGRHPWFGGLSDGQMVGKPLAQPSGRPPVQQ